MIAFVFILAVMIGPAAGAEGTARARSAETSPVHVHNEATPSDARIVLDTRELWRAGAGDDGPLFGVIVQALTDERGNVYLLDKQQSTVWTFAADGRFLGTLTREGEGPGEIRRPADMALLPDGSVGICSEHSGRLRRSPIGDRTGLSARAAERQRKRRHPESVRGLVQIAVRHNRVGGHRARHNEVVDGRGLLWVLSARGVHEQPVGIMATYDVFDANGRFVRQVAVKCDGDGRYDDLFFLGEERLLLITGAYEVALALRGIPLIRDDTADPTPTEVICLDLVD